MSGFGASLSGNEPDGARAAFPGESSVRADPPASRLRQAADALRGAQLQRAGRCDRPAPRRRGRARRPPDLRQRRDVLPLRGVGARRRRLRRPVAGRHARRRAVAQRRADGAGADGRRGGRRVGASRHRRDPVVRLQPPGHEVAPARADQRPRGRPDAGVRRRQPRADRRPAHRPGPGLLPRAGRPHDRAAHADRGPQRAAAARCRRRRAGRRPREARQEVRDPPRRRARDPRPRGDAREPPRDRRGRRAARPSSSTTSSTPAAR